jgi:hypothetical protein
MALTVSCTCPHAVQDAMYGPGQRLANRCDGTAGKGLRCTVCGAIKTTPKPKKEKKEKGDKSKN